MKYLRSILLSVILLVICTQLFGQYYSTGSDPAYIKWRQIKSPFFKVIYPEDFESEANRLVSMLDSLYLYGGYSLNHTPKPIPVVIHSHSAYSNGLVTWAPKRMELYPTSNQSIFSQDYLQQLAIHEFRHVVQIDKINQGFTHILSYPFGEQIVGGILGLYVPLWFLEGDAVLTETTLSKSGRGRVPSFEQEIRALVLEKKLYDYEKAYFGSYKNYIPNHYRMGYLFTAGARHKYGAEVWDYALNETGKNSWSLTPFNKGIKEVTGKDKVPLYNEIFNDWKRKWSEQESNLKVSKTNLISNRDEAYKNYQYPFAIDDKHVIAEANGPGEVNHFVKINVLKGSEEKLITTGLRNTEPFSFANNKICWTELEVNPRWENQYFSIIRIADINTLQQKKLTFKSRYFAPALSPDGKRVAAIHITTDNQREVHIIDTFDGVVLKKIKSPDNQLPLTPAWDETGKTLVMVLLSENGKYLTTLNTSKQKWHPVTQPTFMEVVSPQIINEQIYFSASFSGIDNIYRINTDGSGLQKVTESRFGATQVSAGTSEHHILYQDYTSDGYLIAQANLDSLEITNYATNELPIESFIEDLKKDEKGMPDFNHADKANYESEPYSKWNIFNFHSWAPVNLNVNDATLTQGISLMSQNLLSTAFTTIGYNANKQESREKYYFNFQYRAWLPVIELEVKAGDEKHFEDGLFANATDTFAVNLDAKQQHIYAHLEMNIPLTQTRGKWQRHIQPSISTSYQYASEYSYDITYVSLLGQQWQYKNTETVTEEAFHANPINYGLYAYNIHRRSARDVTSRCGQIIELRYRHTPFSGNNLGSIFGVHTRLYLPGLMKHHSIRIDNGYHKKQRGEIYNSSETRNYFYYFTDFIRFPRGTNGHSNNQLYSFKGDYIFPLVSPDLNIPGVMYLKRITTNLFYDFSYSTNQIQDVKTNEWFKYKKNDQSIGAELRAELHPFRFIFPISIGYRYAYIPNEKYHYNEFLLGMSFSGFSLGN
ncbi:TolB family protein [Carboxylicivirga linearis]|uniref:Uncharacterized protein n=1 Tax=Carboxylicivirga linearis TaxID=1628157 RepID=A0ABS5JUE7_9BACT|nr:hypothetical protein [Carboxylicivirga linearis]MBS2098512.1 hypothetical protein [Carboxylicivirga linearis]